MYPSLNQTHNSGPTHIRWLIKYSWHGKKFPGCVNFHSNKTTWQRPVVRSEGRRRRPRCMLGGNMMSPSPGRRCRQSFHHPFCCPDLSSKCVVRSSQTEVIFNSDCRLRELGRALYHCISQSAPGSRGLLSHPSLACTAHYNLSECTVDKFTISSHFEFSFQLTRPVQMMGRCSLDK